MIPSSSAAYYQPYASSATTASAMHNGGAFEYATSFDVPPTRHLPHQQNQHHRQQSMPQQRQQQQQHSHHYRSLQTGFDNNHHAVYTSPPLTLSDFDTQSIPQNTFKTHSHQSNSHHQGMRSSLVNMHVALPVPGAHAQTTAEMSPTLSALSTQAQSMQINHSTHRHRPHTSPSTNTMHAAHNIQSMDNSSDNSSDSSINIMTINHNNNIDSNNANNSANTSTSANTSSTSTSARCKGNSCHQCKTNKEPPHLYFCTNKQENSSGKRHCRKKYCVACMTRWYKDLLHTGTPGVGHQPPEGMSGWHCPSCNLQCVCAACDRKKERNGRNSSHQHAQVATAAAVVTTKKDSSQSTSSSSSSSSTTTPINNGGAVEALTTAEKYLVSGEEKRMSPPAIPRMKKEHFSIVPANTTVTTAMPFIIPAQAVRATAVTMMRTEDFQQSRHTRPLPAVPSAIDEHTSTRSNKRARHHPPPMQAQQQQMHSAMGNVSSAAPITAAAVPALVSTAPNMTTLPPYMHVASADHMLKEAALREMTKYYQQMANMELPNALSSVNSAIASTVHSVAGSNAVSPRMLGHHRLMSYSDVPSLSSFSSQTSSSSTPLVQTNTHDHHIPLATIDYPTHHSLTPTITPRHSSSSITPKHAIVMNAAGLFTPPLLFTPKGPAHMNNTIASGQTQQLDPYAVMTGTATPMTLNIPTYNMSIDHHGGSFWSRTHSATTSLQNTPTAASAHAQRQMHEMEFQALFN